MYRPEPQDAFSAQELKYYQEVMDSVNGGYGEDDDYADYDEYLDEIEEHWDEADEADEPEYTYDDCGIYEYDHYDEF